MEDDKIEEDENIRSCDVIKIVIVNKIILVLQLLLTYFIYNNSCTTKFIKDSDFIATLPILLKCIGFIMIMIIINIMIKDNMEIKRINSHTRLYYGLMCFCDIMKATMLLMAVSIYQLKTYCFEFIGDSPSEPLTVLIMLSTLSIPIMLGEFFLAYLICKLKRSDTLEKMLEKK